MPRNTDNRSAFLAAVLARALPDAQPAAIARAVQAMQTAARAAKRWSETECSYPLTEAQQARGERRAERLARAASDSLFSAAGAISCRNVNTGEITVYTGPDTPARRLTLRFGGDPRGPCAWLHVSDMPGDGWSADDGFAIYS